MTASTGTVWAAAGINLAGLALVGTLTTVVLTNQWAVAEKLGNQSTPIGTLISEFGDLKKQRTELVGQARQIEKKIELSQLDVGTLLAKAGLPVGTDVKLSWIGEQVVAFPQTAEAAQKLLDRKFERVQFTPSIGGFVADAATAVIVKNAVDNAMAQMDFPSSAERLVPSAN